MLGQSRGSPSAGLCGSKLIYETLPGKKVVYVLPVTSILGRRWFGLETDNGDNELLGESIQFWTSVVCLESKDASSHCLPESQDAHGKDAITRNVLKDAAPAEHTIMTPNRH